jgi:predicted RNase H-like HicB family nuclease
MASEIAIIVERDSESGCFSASWDAPGGGGISTQAHALSELEANIIEAVRCHFEDSEMPRSIRLHFVEDPVLNPA